MPAQPSSQYVFGPVNGGGDILHFLNETGAVVSWITADHQFGGELAANIISISAAAVLTSLDEGTF